MGEPGPDDLRAQLDALAERIEELGGRLAEIGELQRRTQRLVKRQGTDALRTIAADEAGNMRRLAELREHPDYALAWTEERPLVTVTVTTTGRSLLWERALPSILAQTWEELEVIVAGDGAGEEVADRVRALDPRIRWTEVGPRTPWTDDPRRQWLVGSTFARNAAMRLARGRWVLAFDDDDHMRPRCVETLVELARETRAEVVYGRFRVHRGGQVIDLGDPPLRKGQFSWASGAYHAGLRFLERQLVAADLGLPGDWWLMERMIRCGARIAAHPDILSDVHPSRYRAKEGQPD